MNSIHIKNKSSFLITNSIYWQNSYGFWYKKINQDHIDKIIKIWIMNLFLGVSDIGHPHISCGTSLRSSVYFAEVAFWGVFFGKGVWTISSLTTMTSWVIVSVAINKASYFQYHTVKLVGFFPSSTPPSGNIQIYSAYLSRLLFATRLIEQDPRVWQ